MERELGIRYRESRCWNRNTSHTNQSEYSIVFYADDFVVMCESREKAEGIYEKLKPYLKKRGLELSEEKTRVTSVGEGFDFLGFTIRRYQCQQGSKLLVRPSKKSVKEVKKKMSETVKKLHGSNVNAVIKELNAILTGVANYWRPMNAKKTFTEIDNHIWNITYRFVKRLHPKKSWRHWIIPRYYKPDRTGQSRDRWILTAPDTGNQLKKMSWTAIRRHTLVAYKNSPYDRDLKEYYEARKRKTFEGNTIGSRQKLSKMQGYKCPLCGEGIMEPEEKLILKHKIPKEHGGTEEYKNLQLVHLLCKRIYYYRLPKKAPQPDNKQIAKVCKEIKQLRLSGII